MGAVSAVFAFALASASAGAGPVPLDTEETVRALCLDLRPVERMTFQTAEAREAFAKRRQQAAGREYLLRLPWGRFRVREWDRAAGEVTVSTEVPFRGVGGLLTVFDPDRSEIVFRAVRGREIQLAESLRKGTASLVLVLKPAEAEEAPCAMSRAPAYTLASDFISAELRVGAKTVARAEDDDFVVRGLAEGRPTVEVTTAAGPGEAAAQIVEAVARRKAALEACYASGLERNPSLDGSLVLRVEAADGKLLAREVVADSLHDRELERCVTGAVEGIQIQGSSAGGVVAIHLSRTP